MVEQLIARAAAPFYVDGEIPLKISSTCIIELMKMQLLLDDNILDGYGLLKHVNPCKQSSCDGVITSH